MKLILFEILADCFAAQTSKQRIEFEKKQETLSQEKIDFEQKKLKENELFQERFDTKIKAEKVESL